jgi:hypothetical protein
MQAGSQSGHIGSRQAVSQAGIQSTQAADRRAYHVCEDGHNAAQSLEESPQDGVEVVNVLCILHLQQDDKLFYLLKNQNP